MAGVNKAILIGQLGRDPELRYSPSGTAIATFSLATTERSTSRDGNRQERTEWHNIVVFNKQAELVNQYLKKGRMAYIEGRIQTRSWEDRDGNKKYRTEIVANTIQFLDRRGNGQSEYTPPEPSSSAPPRPANEPAPSQVNEQYDTGGDSGGGEDDLPF